MAEALVFVVEDDLKAFLSASEIAGIKQTVVTGPPAVTNIDMCLSNNCSTAYSYLSGVYDTPFDVGDALITDALIKNTVILCVFELSSLIDSISENVLKIREKLYNNAIKWFEDIRDGKTRLETYSDDDTEDPGKYYFGANDIRIDSNFH